MTCQRRWETIPELVASAADRFGDAEAVVDGPLRLSFAELAEGIRCAAGAFAGLGIAKGDRAAVWAPNSVEWIVAAFGLLTAGGVLVPVNTRFNLHLRHDGSPQGRDDEPSAESAAVRGMV